MKYDFIVVCYAFNPTECMKVAQMLRCFSHFLSLEMSSVGLRNSKGPDLCLRYMKRQLHRVGIKKREVSLVLPLCIWVTLDKWLNLSEFHFLPLPKMYNVAVPYACLKCHMY